MTRQSNILTPRQTTFGLTKYMYEGIKEIGKMDEFKEIDKYYTTFKVKNKLISKDYSST